MAAFRRLALSMMARRRAPLPLGLDGHLATLVAEENFVLSAAAFDALVPNRHFHDVERWMWNHYLVASLRAAWIHASHDFGASIEHLGGYNRETGLFGDRKGPPLHGDVTAAFGMHKPAEWVPPSPDPSRRCQALCVASRVALRTTR